MPLPCPVIWLQKYFSHFIMEYLQEFRIGGNMDRKLIFLDIDGTILAHGEEVHPAVLEGLRRARNKGHMVFISTGRSHGSVPPEILDMETDGLICSAGSDIWIHGQRAWSAALDTALVEKACKVLDRLDAICLLEGSENTYMSERGGDFLREKDKPGDNSELARWKFYFRTAGNLLPIKEWHQRHIPRPMVTFLVWGKERMEQLIEELKQDFYIAFFETTTEGVYNGELISLTENKGTAIRRTAELLHENADNTIAFGDSMNDYQMIRDAACGVAMGNADEKLKAIADRVCETVWEDGVICELKRMHII